MKKYTPRQLHNILTLCILNINLNEKHILRLDGESDFFCDELFHQADDYSSPDEFRHAIEDRLADLAPVSTHDWVILAKRTFRDTALIDIKRCEVLAAWQEMQNAFNELYRQIFTSVVDDDSETAQTRKINENPLDEDQSDFCLSILGNFLKQLIQHHNETSAHAIFDLLSLGAQIVSTEGNHMAPKDVSRMLAPSILYGLELNNTFSCYEERALGNEFRLLEWTLEAIFHSWPLNNFDEFKQFTQRYADNDSLLERTERLMRYDDQVMSSMGCFSRFKQLLFPCCSKPTPSYLPAYNNDRLPQSFHEAREQPDQASRDTLTAKLRHS